MEAPPANLRIKSKDELYKLKDRCTLWKGENLCPNMGKRFQIYSPFSKTVYPTCVQEYTDWEELERFIKEGNAYHYG